MEVKCVTAQIAALHPQHSRFRLGCLKLFPTLSPKRIQPQTPPRLPAFLLAAFSPEKDRIWSGEKKKKKKEINPCRFSSSSCRLLQSLFGRTRISAPAVPGSRIRQVTGGSGFAFYLFDSPAQHVGWEQAGDSQGWRWHRGFAAQGSGLQSRDRKKGRILPPKKSENSKKRPAGILS